VSSGEVWTLWKDRKEKIRRRRKKRRRKGSFSYRSGT
jgi:hypothetical protein